MDDIRYIDPKSSLLTFLRCGGVLMLGNCKIRNAQANRSIVLFKNDTLWKEFEFSNAGLLLAMQSVIEGPGL